MGFDRIFKHPGLPFVECRHSKDSGRHYRTHLHRTFGLGIIEKGEVAYEIGGRALTLRPGELALINPETPHSCNPGENKTRHYYMIFLDPDWCLQVQQSLWQIRALCPAANPLLADDGLYRQALDAAAFLMAPGDLMEKEETLADLAEAVFLQACEPGKARRDPPAKIEHLKQRLGRDLDRDLPLARLASDLGANPYTLLRQFRSATGITPHAFRLNCRIEHAKTLLQRGEPLSQVALSCGFFDQSHFHRHFKAATTLTPRAYQVNFIQ
jgi:AraC-like DNA-binding protein